jgi:hypothetical protein
MTQRNKERERRSFTLLDKTKSYWNAEEAESLKRHQSHRDRDESILLILEGGLCTADRTVGLDTQLLISISLAYS